jgi:pyruvate dehydrogenase E2 component (dihydrolipoamide acetyltransferase)
MGKIACKKLESAPVFRKIAFGTWRTCSEASVYSYIDLDMTNALPFMQKYSQQHDVKITPTHLVGKAMSIVLQERPEINGLIRGNRIYLRQHVDLFFSVNIPGKEGDKVGKANLAGCTICGAENMCLADLARALQAKIEHVRTSDAGFRTTFRTMQRIPWGAMGLLLRTISWLLYGLNWNLTWLGLPKDPFGSVIISNLGSLGIEAAQAPLIPYSRVPILLTLGAIHPKAMVVDGQVLPRPVMTVGVTFDHRFMDGSHAAHMNRVFRQCFAEPEKYFAR